MAYVTMTRINSQEWITQNRIVFELNVLGLQHSFIIIVTILFFFKFYFFSMVIYTDKQNNMESMLEISAVKMKRKANQRSEKRAFLSY